jgi:large subunit ribosomal protein L1
VSFPPEKIKENAIEFIHTIQKLKPTAAKGTYIKSIYLSSTMSPGIKVEPKSVTD